MADGSGIIQKRNNAELELLGYAGDSSWGRCSPWSDKMRYAPFIASIHRSEWFLGRAPQLGCILEAIDTLTQQAQLADLVPIKADPPWFLAGCAKRHQHSEREG